MKRPHTGQLDVVVDIWSVRRTYRPLAIERSQAALTAQKRILYTMRHFIFLRSIVRFTLKTSCFDRFSTKAPI
jgi:hypothetical protein